MARDTRQTAAFGPAAIAIHDDRDVRGQARGIDLARKREILARRGEEIEKGFHDNLTILTEDRSQESEDRSRNVVRTV
jgi:hypothetical protein